MQLPKQWQPLVQSAVLNIISVARVAMAWTRGWTDNCPRERVRLKTRADQLEHVAFVAGRKHLPIVRLRRAA